MRSYRGFTLVEFMIVIAILGVLLAVVAKGAQNVRDPTTCKGGYLFDRSSNTQIIGTHGGGVPCDQVKVLPQPVPLR